MKIMKKLNHKIEYGDRIFARLTMGQRTIIEFIADRVSDLSGLLAQLRHLTRGLRGLATLHLRNQSKGWSDQHPIMLYAQNMPESAPVIPSSPFQTTKPDRFSNMPALGHYSL